jgi:hypothetical protein
MGSFPQGLKRWSSNCSEKVTTEREVYWWEAGTGAEEKDFTLNSRSLSY